MINITTFLSSAQAILNLILIVMLIMDKELSSSERLFYVLTSVSLSHIVLKL